jgi:pimeloyl-ACP methyl ester carboxylesterase
MEVIAIEAARLAYWPAENGGADLARLKADLARGGFGEPTVFNGRATGSQGFAALRADGLGLIAFRGTQANEFRDIRQDIDTFPEPWSEVPGLVHEGFAEAAQDLQAQVDDWIARTAYPRKRLLMCGHSLGAAIATLHALRVHPTRLITIGSPRVGDQVFAAAFAKSGVDYKRIVDFEDIVTRVPPSHSPFRFQHVGQAEFIDRNGGVQPHPAPALVDADIEGGRLVASVLRLAVGGLTRDFTDHAPINYLRAYIG